MSGAPVGPVTLTADTFGATVQTSGSAVAPAAGQSLVSTGALAAGTWEVAAWFMYGATGDVGTNVRLRRSGVNMVALPNPGGNNVGLGPFVVRIVSAGADTVDMSVVAAGAAGSVYTAALVARRVA